MVDMKKDKRVLVKVKDLDKEQLETAIDAALDSLFGKDEDEEAAKKDIAAPEPHPAPSKSNK